MSSIPELDEKQLAAARATVWHQDGNPLLSAEAVREWLGNFGLVLFAPRPLQLPAPAPSLLEATLGSASAGPTTEQLSAASDLFSRLVAAGTALPLNLMGVVGDAPDFVVSAQVFSYIFTLRGDKAWKQPPSTSGAVKVSPLGLRAFEVLTERGALTAVQLAAEMGREVTEAATLRVLTELWSQLRVIPLPQSGDAPTVWELTTQRFTKAIKAGANAGQPTAMSALISLYLAQAIAATEEEIATFLSPLTARSRVREVLHALIGARQLETLAVEGKTLLHLPGALLQFAGAVEEAGEDVMVPVPAKVERPKKVGTGRINTFSAERKAASEFRGKPARTFSTGSTGGARPARAAGKPASRFGAKPSGFAAKPARFAPRADGKSDRERRPFGKNAAPAAGKPSFTKPWNEDRKPRPAAKPDSFTKFRRPEPEDRKPLGAREQAGLPPEKRTFPKSSFDRGKPRGFERGAKTNGFGKSGFDRGADRPDAKPRGFSAKRPFTPRPAEDARGSFKPRTFERREKPAGFAPKRPSPASVPEGSGRSLPKRPYKPRAADADQRIFTKAPWVPKTETVEGGAAKRPFKPGGKFGSKPRASFGAKSGGSRPAGTGFGAKKFGPKKFGSQKFGAKPGGKPPARGFPGKSGSSPRGARPSARKRPEAEE